MNSKLNTKPLHRLTVEELVAHLRGKACSAREVIESCLARIALQDSVVRAFVDVDADGAVRRAEELDRRTPSAPLHGVPIAVKETIDVVGLRCTLGTAMHGARVPVRDAIVVRRLRSAGAIIVGTTVSTEYAIARAGATTNPHSPAHTPGGSSSGSAAAVAAGMVPLAVGTQTVGSIVRPSIYCGIFGLKPTYGSISTMGSMPLSSCLDHIGPMARTAADLWLACRVMFDQRPARVTTNGPQTMPAHALRIDGLMQERIEPPTLEALNRAQGLLEARGVEVKEVTLPPRFTNAVACYETILFRDIAMNHGRDRDQFGDVVSERLRRIVDDGRGVSKQDYARAIDEAKSYRHELRRLLGPDTLILAPATDGAAPMFSEETGSSRLQGLWTLVGFPVLAVPCGKVAGLPVGVQLIAEPGCDDLAVQAGACFTAEWPDSA